MYNLFEKQHMNFCSRETLFSLGVNELIGDNKLSFLEYFTDDTDMLNKRSLIFDDTLKIPGLFELLESMVKKLSSIAEILRSKSDLNSTERSVFSIRQLELYFETIDKATAFYYKVHSDNTFQSEEYRELFSKIINISGSDEYRLIKRNTAALIEKVVHIKSVSVGFNIDAKLSPTEMGVLSINDRFIESGKLIDKILRMDIDSGNLESLEPVVAVTKVLQSDEFDLLSDSLMRAVNKIFVRSVRSWPKGISQYIKGNLDFLLDLLPDITFIVYVTRIHKRLLKLGVPLCKPTFHKKDDRVFSAKELYNPILALNMSEQGKGEKLVGNDLTFDRDGRIYILTGPNNGGKTVFMVAVGWAQILAQLGMLVPAASIEISPVDHLYVHFPKYLNKGKMGRLEDECVRIREIFDSMSGKSLCLFDETFSSTDADEGAFLAFEMLRALAYYGSHVIFGTHFHQLAGMINTSKSEGACAGFDFLCAGISDSSQRTYKITRTLPDGRSYARGIAMKYGLSYDTLISKKQIFS